MADDDDDYMSSAFLDVKEDIRPGLVKSQSLKRKLAIEKKKKESHARHYTKPRWQLEEEQRNVGMECALTSDNKGFAMLQKMGYKPGMKLGPQKGEASNSGLQEPIKVKLKSDRGGLGREEEIKKRIKEKEEKKSKIKVYKEKETARLTDEFRQRMRDKVIFKYLMSDLNKIRKVCERLDADEGVEEPLRSWFWFSSNVKYEEDEELEEEDDFDDDESLAPEDQLYFINDYLRGKYYYCLWCGTKYSSVEDMLSNCPGSEKDNHDE